VRGHDLQANSIRAEMFVKIIFLRLALSKLLQTLYSFDLFTNRTVYLNKRTKVQGFLVLVINGVLWQSGCATANEFPPGLNYFVYFPISID